jgi:nitroreductase
MTTVREAIERRRSIRKFKGDEVPEEALRELLEAARLAPSGSNSQPWRFKVAREATLRAELAEAANGQSFVREAPAVLVCCVELGGYIDGSLETIREMAERRQLSAEMTESMISRMETLRSRPRDELAASAAFNVAIAGEHVALRAVELGLGSCWVRAFDESRVRRTLGLGENHYVVALMPLGYPDEDPAPRRRRRLEDILLA